MAIGHAGYLQHTADIIAVTRSIAQGVEKIPGLKLLGDAEAMIVCFTGRRYSSRMNKIKSDLESLTVRTICFNQERRMPSIFTV